MLSVIDFHGSNIKFDFIPKFDFLRVNITYIIATCAISRIPLTSQKVN